MTRRLFVPRLVYKLRVCAEALELPLPMEPALNGTTVVLVDDRIAEWMYLSSFEMPPLA